MKYIVLNDGDTFTSIDGCIIVETEDIEKYLNNGGEGNAYCLVSVVTHIEDSQQLDLFEV